MNKVIINNQEFDLDDIPKTDEEIQSVLDSMTNKEKIKIKDKFIERYKKLTNYPVFMHYSFQYLRRAIRVNTLKISVDKLRKRLEGRFNLRQVPWCKEGFWIDHKDGRRDIGNTLEHSLGYYYIQEPASMIPPVVLNPQPGETILDMAASPGSKTTQIAMYMKNKGILVANDYKVSRLKPLGMNIQRMGITNTVLSFGNGERIKGVKFDRILLDAPCSGTGTIRKSLRTLKIWNPNVVRRIHSQQKLMIINAFNLLKPNGILVFSTCTLEPEENEGTVTYLLNEFPNAKLEDINININRSEPFKEFEGMKFHKDIGKTLRIWPQDNDTEGFFVAKIRKLE
jgi:NOL1/NOP2/sun family putative RNA methylase